MTIEPPGDSSGSDQVVYPRGDVTIVRGHVDQRKQQFAEPLHPSSKEEIDNCTGLKEGTVRNIAGIWEEGKQSHADSGQSTDRKVSSESLNPNSRNRKKNQRKSLYSTKKFTSATLSEDRKPKKSLSRKITSMLEIRKVSLHDKEDKESIKSAPKDDLDPMSIAFPPLHVSFTEKQMEELEIAADRLKVYIDIYKDCFWPPKVQGVFRVSPSAKTLRDLDLAIQKTSVDKLSDMFKRKSEKDSTINEYLLAGIIKKTLIDLSIPAIPIDLYEHFMTVAKKEDKHQIPLLEQLVQQIPPVHRRLVGCLMIFLRELSSYEAVTSMSAKNLAIVIAPSMLIAPDGTPLKKLLDDSKLSNEVVTLMIEQSQKLFIHDNSLTEKSSN